jgi:hypothetical protein
MKQRKESEIAEDVNDDLEYDTSKDLEQKIQQLISTNNSLINTIESYLKAMKYPEVHLHRDTSQDEPEMDSQEYPEMNERNVPQYDYDEDGIIEESNNDVVNQTPEQRMKESLKWPTTQPLNKPPKQKELYFHSLNPNIDLKPLQVDSNNNRKILLGLK